ncbi:MAG: nickel/cobalt efflux protein RcnA [Rhizobiales bacterium PAR1]|nr:MAG: nickel/cobalt efflux protein RcnA [Rhizobiales bacterium PAR1]
MPDIAQLIVSGASNPWVYLPLAVLLGALHALEPGHSKSIMAAFLVAVRGTPAQAVLLGVSAAIGHTLVVWLLVIVGLWLGSEMIEKQAYPWLVLLSGLMIVAIALRLAWIMRPRGHHHHDHDHHQHDHGHHHMSPEEIAARFGGRQVGTGEVIWFGFTGGLLPCPSAIAVLLVALQMKAYALGVAMVAAFSVGLAMTLVAVGMVAVWGSRKLAGAGWFDGASRRLPLISACLVFLMGCGVIWHAVTLLRAI